jgi:hypothetical protein
MADEYDPFNLRKHPGYYAELVQERDPTHDVAASYVKNHQYDGGILGRLERNPHGLGDSPLPFDPTGAEVRSTSEGGSAFAERPKDHMQPVAELISPTLGAFGAGQMAGTAYKEAGEGDYQEAGMSLAPLLAGMVVPGAPKGARGPKVLSREIDARGFYSPSLEAVKGLGQESGTVQQFRSMLLKAGGKPKELEAVGFDRAFPDPNAKVSRGEIEQYLRDNRVQLGETRYGTREAELKAIRDERAKILADADAIYGHGAEALSWAQANPRYRELNRLEGELSDTPNQKFESYSTPGGIPGSYREVVTTLPRETKTLDQIAREKGYKGWGSHLTPEQQAEVLAVQTPEVSPSSNYISSHWPGITNPVLHYRTKDFQDVSSNRPAPAGDGSVTVPSAQGSGDFLGASGSANVGVNQSKVRVLDEMQSDWAQRARDAGFNDPAKVAELQRAHEQALASHDAASKALDDFADQNVPDRDPRANAQAQLSSWLRHGASPEMKAAGNDLFNRYLETKNAAMDAANKANAAKSGVPPAPYISNTSDWVDLGLKKFLIDAARDDVARVAWTPGKVQADRYGLEKHVKSIGSNPVEGYGPGGKQVVLHGPGGVVASGYIDGNGVIQKGYDAFRDGTGKHLSEFIGKEMSDKVLSKPEAHVLEGQDLRMGGEGMKSFYGDMTPEGYQSGIVGTRLQKLVKGLDPEAARVGEHRIPSGATDKGERSIVAAAKSSGVHSQQATQIGRQVAEIVVNEGAPALDTYSAPKGFEPAWQAAVAEAKRLDAAGEFHSRYPSIPITPAMREKILKEGLPLFNIAALSALMSRILGQGQPDTEDEGP